MMTDSLLMCDSTEGDGKAEIVMDYIMSYSLRHAVDKYLIEKPMLCRYCRYMLGVLLSDIFINDNAKIKSVKVWKEWQYMDLCVEVLLEKGETKQTYAILIENKYYSKLRENQLVDYKKKFDEYYDNNKEVCVPKANRRYKLVTCHETEEMIKLYSEEVNKTKNGNKNSFEMLSFYELLPEEYLHDETYEETESDIFNEFWLRKW